MPELWARAPDATKRKLRKLYAADQSGVTRKLKELWARDGGGVNRKIFSGGFETALGDTYYGSDGANTYNIHTLQNGIWSAGFGATAQTYTSRLWGGGYLILHIPDDMVAPLTITQSSPDKFSYHCENQTSQNEPISLVIGAFDSSGGLLVELFIYRDEDWPCQNTFAGAVINQRLIYSIPPDRIVKLRMSVECYSGTDNWDANSKLYLQMQTGCLLINNVPVEF